MNFEKLNPQKAGWAVANVYAFCVIFYLLFEKVRNFDLLWQVWLNYYATFSLINLPALILKITLSLLFGTVSLLITAIPFFMLGYIFAYFYNKA